MKELKAAVESLSRMREIIRSFQFSTQSVLFAAEKSISEHFSGKKRNELEETLSPFIEDGGGIHGTPKKKNLEELTKNLGNEFV
jgi:hypothetical protein